MNDWESKTCIKFIERTNEKDYVNFFRGTQWEKWVFLDQSVCDHVLILAIV